VKIQGRKGRTMQPACCDLPTLLEFGVVQVILAHLVGGETGLRKFAICSVMREQG